MTAKTKIVLDADVIIHFVKAGQFSLLLDIFPEYQYIILDCLWRQAFGVQNPSCELWH